jgi:Copper transport outer membrane protein, MctB
VNSSILPAGSQLSTVSADQGSQAGDLLGIVLQLNKDPAAAQVSDEQRDTALTALHDTGFVDYTGRVGPANTALVVTGGGLGDDAGNKGSTVARFAAALAPRGSGTVLAGRDGSASGTASVAVTRADTGMASAVSTVDDVNTQSGRLTAVLALADLISGGRPGQYGIGQGASSVTTPQ